MSAADELERMYRFFYLCPVGLIEVDNAGAVQQVNPAAVRMLAPALEDAPLRDLVAVLDRLSPGTRTLVGSRPQQVGQLAAGRRIELPASSGCTRVHVEVQLHRVDPQRVVVLLQDVSAEHRLAEQEHRIAVELQRSLLRQVDVPDLPTCHAYRAAAPELEVGGDWYDVIALPDGAVAHVVGDVVGHGVHAAATMGQMRSALRALAPAFPDPADLLGRVAAFAEDVPGAACTTVAYAVLDPRDGRLTYACAGHPPPLLIGPDGTTRFLEGGRTLPLASLSAPRFASAHDRLTGSDALLLYTDGLVERRGQDLDAGLDRLRTTAQSLSGAPPDQLCDLLVADMTGNDPLHDDICMLAVRWAPLADLAAAGPRAAGRPRGRVSGPVVRPVF
ncbi:PP2C family protein-serine/threonine phosphatase [Geodermatophilus poikilotrophus]|uniref:Serine phosphatase RsbU, regulator of sigma subunit n=1 Tax=Geodermatophilus poikilotrophus TaxID=1333667 RepID=A0A1H9ZPH5_9ACTN|nr:PP2C family protein-serine/threonine phosphatase [Geodermatophilus poikilotrophus]SES83587.1 Serine phosphatase RsbU, regulator of sigma subunit [Geodermatophilus poikilotrophus]